ncbi:hypothetical protein GJ697_06925 [Pseudoduganella sp. FT25W]|uniref:Tail specific protease domain-containing protein n=1 Tax=Duganella alba TaxID=2666081 RepID=A0A6L5QD47_9BURK|nr:S41 family peptidase [Duganella alba]MRX07559.1 hypothetical protein [Duganella alba]MRX15944.1 hypothetical protein [Duganella alba]
MGRKSWIAAAVLLLMTGAGAQTAAPPVLDEALDAPTRAHIVNEYARRLTELHVDPARAKAAADDLRQRLARGEYDDQLTARGLAARVTRDVAAISPDRHTYLEWVPYDLGNERQRPAPPVQSADNFGLRRFETLADNVGYLKITRFAPLDRAAIEAAGRFMSQAADCPALIIDVRDAGGDGQAMAALLSSYVLSDRRSYLIPDKQLHLHDQIDRNGKVVAEFWTTADVAGRRFGGRKPLYVLVNERTSDAAEAFAYDLQQYVKRAVVVGAPTLGDARVGAKQRISRQLQTSIAITRASNVITRANWEGMGVQPDRITTSALAQETALAMARQAMLR